MFKSLIGASAAPLKSGALGPRGLTFDESRNNDDEHEQEYEHQHGKEHQQEQEQELGQELEPSKSSRANAMKRGRRKLTSIMIRLRTGGKKQHNPNCPSSGDQSDASRADDEETYETAEEVCRKMSLGGNSLQASHIGKYDEHRLKQQLELHKNRTSRRPSHAPTSTSRHEDDDDDHGGGAEAEDDERDKRDILPEELCDIPTFLRTRNCDRKLVNECRRLLRERYTKNPGSFYEADYQRMLQDDWTVTRFLLRRRQDPKRTAKLMEECGKFRKTYKMSEVQLWEFPVEFHKAGGLFKYAPDRVGNVTMYMRVKMYRRVPEISDVFKAFILCVLEQCDVANNGRGTAVIFDLSDCGLQNVDLGFLSWLLSSFRNYCPKGVSYILVYNLPWILSATCKLAMTWMSASNRRSLRFSHGDEIETFIARENLPDYLGGSCKLNYRQVPADSRPATEVCHRFDLTPKQALKIKELFKEYINDEDDGHAGDIQGARDQGFGLQVAG